MSARNVQLVKWTLPAFALIVGFFWYKRRRVDRVDPGGVTKLRNISVDDSGDDCRTESKAQKRNLNLYDSGIHIDESYVLNSSSGSSGNEAENRCSPRRVSQSLDIPSRRSGSQQISNKSGSSLNETEAWYAEVDEDDEDDVAIKKSAQAIVLGSNPMSANFDMAESMREIRRNKCAKGSAACRDNDDVKVVRVFDNVTEEEETTSSVDNKVCAPSEGSVTNHAGDNACRSTVENCEVSRVENSMSETKIQGAQAISERDSANHSPVSGVLEGSVTDEARSEGSTDSGKGGSIKGNAKDTNPTTYEFAIPHKKIGRLIGKGGSFIREVNAQAGVMVTVKRYPATKDFKICAIQGTPDCIKTALKMIRQRFPNIGLEEFSVVGNPEEISWVSELMHLPLIEGVNNDVIVCHIYKPNHLFVQLPTHPTYPSLRILDQNMTQLYENVESPPVPDQLTRGMLVVAKWYDRWVRAYVENPDASGQQNLVRLVDHGGYWTFSNAEMRKIRSDYLTLPFQAIEVFLANVQPINGEWKQEAYDVVARICSGSIGQAQIEGYIDSSVYVSLYLTIQEHGVISVADELVARGFAVPVTLDDVAVAEPSPIA